MMGMQRNKIVQLPRHPKTNTGSVRGARAGAYIFQIGALALLAAATVHVLPRWGMLLTATFWLAFSIYWGVAG